MLVSKNIKGMEALYDQYGSYIFGLIYEIIRQEDLAESVLQDTFLKVWTKIDSYSSKKGRFLTWMMNIARNTAIDMTRSKNYKQTLKLISLDSVGSESRTTNTDVRMENIDVRDIVFGLDDKYKSVIDLVYFQGFTHAEAAKQLNLPLGTIKSRVRKALSELRKIFES